jgi:hypothetical protein
MIKADTVPRLDGYGITNMTVELYDPPSKTWTMYSILIQIITISLTPVMKLRMLSKFNMKIFLLIFSRQ